MCHSIIEFHKKIEKLITKIFDNTKELKQKQIKSKSHLQELIDTVNFSTKEFDKYRQKKKRERKIMNNLLENVSMLAKKVDDHLEAVEKYEQVSRCNCLLMHQISEKKQENTVKFVQSNK